MSEFTTTPNYGLKKPDINADDDQWGVHLNEDLDLIDNIIKAQQLRSYAVYLGDYGVKCDGVTDDGPAFNAAMVYVRANLAQSGKPSANLIWPQGPAMIRTTLDLTHLDGIPQLYVTAYGTVFYGHTTDMPIIDFTGSTLVRWYGGRVIGDLVDTPACAFRLGRSAPPPQQGSRNCLYDVTAHGAFTFTAFYLNQAESTVMQACWGANVYPTADQLAADPTAQGGSAIMLDGLSKYWAAIPTVCPGAVTPGLGSFLEPTFICCAFSGSGLNPAKPSTAIWICNSNGASFTNGCYAVTLGAVGGPVITIYSEPGCAIHNLDLGDMHKEAQYPVTQTFPMILFDGTHSPAHRGMAIRDPSEGGASTYLFGRTAGVAHITLDGLRLSIANPNNWDYIFDDGNAYTVSGELYLGNDVSGLGGGISMWNLAPGHFTGGTLNISGVVQTLKTTAYFGNDTSAGQVNMLGPEASGRQIRWGTVTPTTNFTRWIMGIGATPESGADVGAQFALYRCHDDGTVIDAPFSLDRASGNLTLSRGLNFGSVAASAPNDLSRHLQVSTTGYGLSFTSGRLNIVTAVNTYFVNNGVDIGWIAASGLNGMPIGAATPSTGVFTNLTGQTSVNATASLVVGNNTNAAAVNQSINGAAAAQRQLRWLTANSARWSVGMSTAAEGGSNAGADFTIARYADAGTLIDAPVIVSRATGSVKLQQGLGIWNTTSPAAKPTVTGSRAGNAALASALTALASYGLFSDSSTA